MSRGTGRSHALGPATGCSGRPATRPTADRERCLYMRNTGANPIGEGRPRFAAGMEVVAFGASYALFSLLVMVVNTTMPGLGDPKFGPTGWPLYWPLWAACFSPAVLVASIARNTGRAVQPSSWLFWSEVEPFLKKAARMAILAGTVLTCVGSCNEPAIPPDPPWLDSRSPAANRCYPSEPLFQRGPLPSVAMSVCVRE